ncbi:MAG: DUF1549 domain-containing protein [Acidobacteriaceae bacterium]|nr:DUF1549 domain-containing protein [Acidobacteriaceae bacterium]
MSLLLGQTPAASDAHAPLFRPKANTVSQDSARLTAHLPKPAAGRVAIKGFIDEEILGKMKRDQIPHAPLATDLEFLRRVRLDLTGKIPTATEVREFLSNRAPDKRARLIDQLIGSPEFVDKWAYFFMDVLRANGKMGRGHKLFHYALKESLAADRPYDDWVRSLIAASAKSNYVVSAVNPIVREHVEGKPGEAAHGDDLSKVNQLDTHDELTILYGKVFLGINLSCVSCHNGRGHLEKVNAHLTTLRRSDFFQMSAFLGGTRYIPHVEKSAAVMGHFLVDDFGGPYNTKSESMLRTKRSGGPNTPKFVLTNAVVPPEAEPRAELGRMLTSHPQFARATVNMFWAKLMGIGIVDPYDEFDLLRLDPNNLPKGWDLQPSHPALLEKLADSFRQSNHSIQSLFRLICNSSAYQLSARFPGEWQESYARYYARKYVRMLTAEELHDAIADATTRPGSYVAMQVSVPQAKGELKSFMSAFGESNRGGPPRTPAPSPLQPITMMRSPVVNDRVLAAKDSRVQRLLDTYPDNGKVVDELFLATISRLPLPAERAVAVDALKANRVEGAQNLQWALLNLVEFLYNL